MTQATGDKPAAKSKAAAKANPQKAQRTSKRTDWEAVERDFRAGKLTYREMADKHHTTPGRISQVSKDRGWIRGDLKEVVQKATQAMLIAEHVEGEVNKVKQGLNDTVLAAAQLNKQVILQHRSDMVAIRGVAMDMLAELNATTVSADKLNAMFEMLEEDMGTQQLVNFKQQVRDFMRLHNRVGSVHKLADTLKKVQELECKAYGLDDQSDAAKDFESLSDEELDQRIEGCLARRQPL